MLAALTLALFTMGQPPAKAPQTPLDRGANAASEAAITKGLRWLARHQAPDGHWGLHDFNKFARTEPLPNGKLAPDNSTPEFVAKRDVAGTALALLPFLAAGHTHRKPTSPYRTTVQLGLNYLMKQQAKASGELDADMYSHCLALLALCEAYRVTKDPLLRKAAQAGVDYLVDAQHEGGGWRYRPKQPGDMSVTSFAVRALVSAQRGRLKVPQKTLENAEKYIASVTSPKSETGYVSATTPTPTMTAAATYCRLLLKFAPENAVNLAAGMHLSRMKFHRTKMYFTFYATQALYELGGKEWQDWNEGADGTRDWLVKQQDDGNTVAGNAGSWKGDHLVGGRLGATSFALLTLLVYHRDRGPPDRGPAVEP